MNTDSLEYKVLMKIVEYYEKHRIPEEGSELLLFVLWLIEEG